MKLILKKGNKEVTGLLTDFMKNMLQNYEEPTRKGTPRGEPIGFSNIKYASALLALTNIEIKQQAEILNVSYGLLRKWRTEDKLSDQVIKNADEFALFFEDNLTKHIKKTIKLSKAWSNKLKITPIKDILNIKVTEAFPFLDALDEEIKIYGNILIVSVSDRLKDGLQKFIKFKDDSYYLYTYYVALSKLEDNERIINSEKKMASAFIKRAIDIISDKQLTKNKIKDAIMSMDIAKNLIQG